MFLSESDCFVAGSPDAVQQRLEVLFLRNLQLTNQLLGFAVAPKAKHKLCAIGEVSADKSWAKAAFPEWHRCEWIGRVDFMHALRLPAGGRAASWGSGGAIAAR
jgi:hypothetical protein